MEQERRTREKEKRKKGEYGSICHSKTRNLEGEEWGNGSWKEEELERIATVTLAKKGGPGGQSTPIIEGLGSEKLTRSE